MMIHLLTFAWIQHILSNYKIPSSFYEVYDIERMAEREEILDYMMEITGGRTASHSRNSPLKSSFF